MLYQVAILLLLLSCVTSQTKYCCAPNQFETQLDLLTGGLNNGKVYFVQESQNISIDGNLHKVASSLQAISNGVTTNIKVLQDYDGGKQYTVTNGVCQTSPLEPWTPKCVPDDAELLEKTYIGTGDKKIDFDVYRFTKDPNSYYIDVASEDCVPLALTATGYKNNVSGYTVGTYSNITMGIKDPSVFDIPESCKHRPFHTHVGTGHLHTVF